MQCDSLSQVWSSFHKVRGGPKGVCSSLPGDANEDFRTEYGREHRTFPGERGLIQWEQLVSAKVQSYEIVQDVPRIIRCWVVEYLLSKYYIPIDKNVTLLQIYSERMSRTFINEGARWVKLVCRVFEEQGFILSGMMDLVFQVRYKNTEK